MQGKKIIKVSHTLLSLVGFVILLLVIQGCPVNLGTTPSPPTLYSLEIDPGQITSYPGGGGLSMVTMTPGEDFQEPLKLSLEGDSLLGARLSDTVLTAQKQTTEVSLFPDTIISLQTYTIQLVVVHGDQTNRFPLVVRVIPYSPGPQRKQARIERNKFLSWLEVGFPDYTMPDSSAWFGYNKNPDYQDLFTWVFLSDNWEIDIRWQNLTSTPYWFLLRRRSEAKPQLAAKESADGEINLVPVEFYEGWE